MKLYEAMFVVDSNKSRQDHDKVVEELSAVIQKGGGEVVNCDKWDERKLAYTLSRHKRGTYYLSHFRSDGETIGRIERAAQLSETVLRVLITVDEDGEAFPVYADTSDDGPRGRRGGDRSRRSDGPRPPRKEPDKGAQRGPARPPKPEAKEPAKPPKPDAAAEEKSAEAAD
ncbi:MAG: 30S ribosomal protein S6 [Planctomycetota bacterium]